MARPGVTYQDIANAAYELKGQGRNVTIEGVRDILGTGSIGTINQHLRKWKEVEVASSNIARKENLPDSLIALVKGLWESMLAQSTEQFMPTEEAYKQEISELKSELEKYKHNNQRWQKMFNQWQQEKTSLANKKLTLEQAIEFAHKENQSLKDKQDGLRQQLQEKQERIDELHRLHQQTQTNLEHYRESAREQRLLDHQQFEQQKQLLSAEIKTLKEITIDQQSKIFDLKEECRTLSQNNHILEEKNVRIQKECEELEAKYTIVNNKCNELHIACQTYENQNKQLLAAVDNQSNQIINYQAEIKILSNKIFEIKNDLNDTKDQLKFIAQEKWEVIQEKARLEGQLKQMQKFLVT